MFYWKKLNYDIYQNTKYYVGASAELAERADKEQNEAYCILFRFTVEYTDGRTRKSVLQG